MAPTFHFFSVLGEEDTSTEWTVDFLLPNGVMITLDVDKEAALDTIKEDVWKKAQEFPLHSKLKGKNSYVFSSVNQMAERCVFDDEAIRLCDAGLFQPILKVEEKIKNNDEANLKAQISTLIGKGVHEFDALKSIEVSNFRVDKKKMCERIARERDSQSWLQRVLCLYPPNIASDDEPPPYLEKKLNQNGNIQVRVSQENATVRYTFHIPYNAAPEELIVMMLRKQANTVGARPQPAEAYCLKVTGREEYLLGNYPLMQYNYIRRSMGSDIVPQLVLVMRNTILEGEPPTLPPKGPPSTPVNTLPHAPLPPNPRAYAADRLRNHTSLWNMDPDEKFQIVLQGIANVDLPDFSKIQVRAGIYHGLEATGDVINSMDRHLKDGYAEWNEPMTFGLPLPDLPRMARLCFLMYLQNDRRKDKKSTTIGGRVIKIGKMEIRPIAWVNIPVFDFQGVLHTGSQTLYMWSLTDDDCLFDSALNPIGTVECNPDADEAVQLRFEFSKYNQDSQIVFPSLDTVLQVAAENTKEIGAVANVTPMKGLQIGSQGRGMINSSLITPDQLYIENLRHHVNKDPLQELAEQDKKIIWKLRLECHEYFPESLPKVLGCVQWDDHINVALMQALLQIWRPILPEEALEMLDFRYPDKEVRRFAVRCLRKLSDGDLCQYLLQLVQVLKYEPYLDCDLVNFLLEKALNNQLIGHQFFWLLRSEMHVSSVSVRFGLILEAFCYGNKNHLKSLTKQVEALRKLHLINESVKHMSHVEKMTRDRIREEMRKLLTRNLFLDSLSQLNCFLDPARVMKAPIVEKCKVMDSKMKPMWMVWSNQDMFGDSVNMLYKKGDDLRQDMLTLQILRIMDNIWQKEGLDLRLNAYPCLSTGQNEGMIGIVTEAETIATVQKKYTDSKLKSAFNKTCLFEWLKEKNNSPALLEKALEEFTLSCAGYCVATYILGIGDRHSDNILLRENGQLVHIDFGHILGHFKSKMGFKRERVPFVLTADFVYLIQRGPQKSHDCFNTFKQTCERAYMILRRHSHFLITLFMMMMNTGMPELSSLRDLEFLRQTLVPHYSDAEARKHWHSKCHEALKNSFWSSVNFAFHNAARDNKQ